MDFRSAHRHLLRDLGHLPGDGVPASHGWMARQKGRYHGDRGPGVLGHHLGGAHRHAIQPDAMKLLITGVSHKTAPVEVRERLAFSESALPAALAQLRSRDGVSEALILSTCNRVEIAATGDDGVDLRGLVCEFL